ncbi:hypothetical protein BT93_L1192 [Corymbia citriodora subsp. variegata]|uniref:Uncharacterized protein n=1 Tax=Corymbia citriodora subsp. variegata TaxID=360336 RepID=A0A8T0CNA7_CORYI|nr:hypothetical protein BT93_L1192 [Corymbia citriodora subsp. variegata]
MGICLKNSCPLNLFKSKEPIYHCVSRKRHFVQRHGTIMSCITRTFKEALGEFCGGFA